MAQVRKFGTFGGVFTPSILTILGVIMYLRLGWVVGQAGIIWTIAIILIAHIISVSTGLSVSSVATDKKVKAGGLYYMLSRSLGLPIGGSIGIALYAATALSISMYIVGFGESFNAVIGFTPPDASDALAIRNLRITGSATLLVITSIALISTSLAIKSQYYIMGAIFLSIISVVAGGFLYDSEFIASVPNIGTYSGGESIEAIFGIFFPAVTGFTAGVAMSGDLKDPKKSIPTGTMSAIIVGFVVYLGLALFLAFRIDREYLLNDYNILSKISLLAKYGSPLVVSGIWGATLSSALGGILGGPRILQAMSVDKITPKLFAKGTGKENEPRNALIVTFVIAEVGVLIGKLDLIAPIVSMFYLTAYGFINFTCALESWSGSDFRPQFKIPRFISVMGAIATFAVMFKLNFGAMLISFVIIGALFFYFTKKQINLGFSNIWQGVYAEIVRRALFKIGKREHDQRNWRPNILLFSGAANQREYLVEFGLKLVGRLGLISNFNVLESKQGEVLSKSDQALNYKEPKNGSESYRGVFARQLYSQNVYEGMANIAETYGFSGIEPNTILIGWARSHRAESEFVPLLRKLHELDYNILVMDYEKKRGFGKREKIDIWWEGSGRNLSFILTMIRFITTTDDWLNAKIRMVIHLSSIDTDGNEVLRNITDLLEEFRMQIEIKTINTLLDNRPLYELIKTESADADLIFTELKDIHEEEESTFYKETTKLCNETGTIVMYRASTEFKDVQMGVTPIVPVSRRHVEDELEENELAATDLYFTSLELPEHEVLAEWIENLRNSVEKTISTYFKDYLGNIYQIRSCFIKEVDELVIKTENDLRNKFRRRGSQGKIKILEIHTKFLEDFRKLVLKYRDYDLESIKKQMELGGQMFQGEISYLSRTYANKQRITFDYEHLKDYRPDLFKSFGFYKKVYAKTFKSKLTKQIPLDKVCTYFIYCNLVNNQDQLASKITTDAFRLIAMIQKNINLYFQKLTLIENQFNDKDYTFGKAQEEIKKVQVLQKELHDELITDMQGYQDFLVTETVRDLQKVATNLDKLQVSSKYYSKPKMIKAGKQQYEKWLGFPDVYRQNLGLYTSFLALDVSLKLLQNSLRERIIHYKAELQESIYQESTLPLKNLQTKLQRIKSNLEKGETGGEIQPPAMQLFSENGSFKQLLDDLKNLTGSLPYEMETIEPEAMNNPSPERLEEIPSMSFSPSVVANFHLQTIFIEPLIVEMRKLRDESRKAGIMVKDVTRLINFGIESIDNQADDAKQNDSVNELIKLIQEETKKMKSLSVSLKKSSEDFLVKTDKLIADVSDRFNAYTIVKSSANIGFNLRNRSRVKAISRVANVYEQIKEKGTDSLTQLIYRRSEGLLAAKKLTRIQEKGFLVEDIINLKEKVVPSREAIQSLPYYYGQLFLSGHLSGDELWYGRKKQLALANKAVVRFKNKSTGSLLVKGAPRSGKTFLADYIAHQHFNKEQIYRIDPPSEGCIDLKEFKATLGRKLKLRGSIDSVINRISPGSVIIFEDMERWWSRMPDGYDIIHYLMDITDRFSHQYFFIVVMNPITYRYINKTVKLEDSFMQVIDCEPFDAKSLRDIILLRHQSSGMKFKLDEDMEDKISRWKLANLFSATFDLSNGNVGTALQTWISCVEKVEDNVLKITIPKPPSVDVLRRLPSAWIVILIQLILHRRLTVENLDKIMNHSEPQLSHHIATLKRSGLVEEEKNLLKINRFMEHFIIQVFTEDGIL
ncbi:MAG: hypothetical protein CMO01_06405 [Thalassobius sp.]|nr:hypothetical protein [Thalassovita sp.]